MEEGAWQNSRGVAAVLENALQHHLDVFCSVCVLHRSRQYIGRHHSNGEEFKWDLETQGIILSSFYVGYMIMQVLGGFGRSVWRQNRTGTGGVDLVVFTIVTPGPLSLGCSFC